MNDASRGNSVTIRLLKSPQELEQALAFIHAIAFGRHGATPPPPPLYLFAAYTGEKIVGTLGLDFGSTINPLPIESRWQFDHHATPLAFERELIAEYGRWMAVQPGVSSALMYTASLFAKSAHKHYGICEVKLAIKRHLAKLGLLLSPINHAECNIGAIPESGRPYYLNDPPGLYMFDIDFMLTAAQAAIASITSLTCDVTAPTSP